MTSSWARFWVVDLHVHTPGSSDARDEDFGTAVDIVRKALDAGLDAIAVTDHNTAAWCGQMAEAAEGSDLVVLPGFELSTSDGHLLGIWEEGTAPSTIEDVLIRLGIERSRFGDLNVVSAKGMAECASEIRDKGGIAIAAHIDKDRGILIQPVQTHVNQLLADPNIAAFEYVLAGTPAKVAAKLGETRRPALIQSSDAYDAALSRHAAAGIGIRRSWIKAARPDLCGLRYALQDPDLRVTLTDPATAAPHPTIDSVSISGGFLSGTALEFSPDLNCLLGGTGAGKSLVLEALRFALDQQVDGALFNTIRDEVDRRLETALLEGTTVAVEISTPTAQYRVSRMFSAIGSTPVVEQDIADEWVRVDHDPAALLTVSAFSQGEILEYARQPVGRMGLIDAKLDLAEIDARIAESESKLRANGTALIAARDKVQTLTEQASDANSLRDRERELSALFDDDLVKSQGRWTAEQGALATLAESVDGITFVRPSEPDPASAKMTPEHDAQFEKIRLAQVAFKSAVDAAEKLVAESLVDLKTAVGEVKAELDAEFQAFKKQLDETLEKSGSTSLPLLRRELETAQTNRSKAEAAAQTLKNDAEPAYNRLSDVRETLLGELKQARDDRRTLRRDRVADLNRKTSGFVKIDIPAQGDTASFRQALDALKVGSRVREQALDLIAENIRPYNFVRALWTGDTAKAGHLPDGVTAVDFARLLATVDDRDLWEQLLEAQLIATPDVLKVKFRKPEGRDYVNIEDLSHGQKCTAILVILLADGETPVLIDQPEDALHAPWIEEYLVDRLRQLRGSRQYMFATRSPGLVVSADSEQLITMRATAGKGEVEACGSLERYDLNKLALHHLEGGRTPFARRARKLDASLTSNV
ncbi:phosphoesterase [Flexivirga endophytica]|uniref:Phosphoesterase n=1 Tax=Flexivirga endophytica TaxID=1849103 RepID=A0A916SXV4_9MICO|nr:AAA family ATPase [Flexivirga endophytica]GGB23225.1 phosphoesterase [Flexivirga endophytica]GHB57144.1 phosphoesterase [Flexivirga endophytica]